MTSKTNDKQKSSNKTAQANHTPGDVDKDDQTSDIDPKELDRAGNRGAGSKGGERGERQQAKANEPSRKPLKEGEHLPGADFRTRVENTAAGDLDWPPREPYPKGNPPDHRESFHRIHGYYPPEEGGEKDAQASQMDADPKT